MCEWRMDETERTDNHVQGQANSINISELDNLLKTIRFIVYKTLRFVVLLIPLSCCGFDSPTERSLANKAHLHIDTSHTHSHCHCF